MTEIRKHVGGQPALHVGQDRHGRRAVAIGCDADLCCRRERGDLRERHLAGVGRDRDPEGKDGAMAIESINPATEEVLARYDEWAPSRVDAAPRP